MTTLQPAPKIDSETSSNLSKSGVSLGVKDELNELVGKLKPGKDIGRDEIQEYNKKLRKSFKEKFEEIGSKIEKKLERTAADSEAVKRAKELAAKGILNFLDKIFDWIVKALEWVLEKIEEGIEWCFKKVSSLFEEAIASLLA